MTIQYIIYKLISNYFIYEMISVLVSPVYKTDEVLKNLRYDILVMCLLLFFFPFFLFFLI